MCDECYEWASKEAREGRGRYLEPIVLNDMHNPCFGQFISLKYPWDNGQPWAFRVDDVPDIDRFMAEGKVYLKDIKYV